MSGTSHYETLGVARDASAEEIEKAYRRLRKRVHPDAQGSHGLFIHVQTAYETLSDPQKRRTYDAGIEEPAAGSGENPPPRSRQRTSSRQPFGPPPDLALPAALPRMAGAVHYQPPLQVPEPQPPPPAERVHRVAGWAKITFIAVGSLGALIGLLTLLNGLQGTGLEPRTITNSVVITVFFLIIGVIPVIISKAVPRRPPAPEPARPLAAADVLRPEHIARRVFGRPGTAGWAGPEAASQPDRSGAERIARFLEQTLLPSIPSARLLHGVRAGAVVDHLIAVDNRVLVVDSTLRQDGSYRWDDHQLYLDGNPVGGSGLPAAAYDLGQVISRLSPRYVVHGYLLVHSHPANPARPEVEYRPLPIDSDPRPGVSRLPVEAGNPEQFLVAAYRFLTAAEDPARVDLQLIRLLLARTDVT